MAVLGVLDTRSRGEVPGKKKEGTAGGVSGGGSFLWTRRGAWCLVFGKEDRRSWRGSLVSGERRRLMKRRRSCWFCFERMEPVLGTERGPRGKVSRWFLTLAQPLGKESTPGKRYRC